MNIGKVTWTGDGTSPRILFDANLNNATRQVVAAFVHGVNIPEQVWITPMAGSTPLAQIVATFYAQGIMSGSTGCFAVGSDNVANQSGVTYFADIIYQDTDLSVDTGFYTGTAASRNIATTDASVWEWVLTVPIGTNSDQCVLKLTTPMASTNSIQLATGSLNTTLIGSVVAGQFTLGSANAVNRLNATYNYLAMASVANVFSTYTYAGTGASQATGSTSFTPTIGLVKGNQSTSGFMRHPQETGFHSMNTNGSTESATGIIGFLSTGMEIGTNAAINTNLLTYYAAVMQDTNVAPPQPPNPPSRAADQLLLLM